MYDISFVEIAAAVLCLLSVLFVCCKRYEMRQTMERMSQMIRKAEEGAFQEEMYDESMISALETRLANYLASARVTEQKLAEEKNKVKELIADISHQTKTPVANILLYAQLLKEKELTQEAFDYAKEVNHQAEKLRFLIDVLVKTSRLENGVFVLHPKKNPVSLMLKETIDQIGPKAKEKNITVEFAPRELYAVFDRKWTEEAIGNILDNAVKYTSEDGKIRIDVLDTELFVRIDISDTGIGIPEEETAKIFQRFYRSRTVSDQDGVGIGLYLAREIITEEGGYMKVKSQAGKGSVFSVYLLAVGQD